VESSDLWANEAIGKSEHVKGKTSQIAGGRIEVINLINDFLQAQEKKNRLRYKGGNSLTLNSRKHTSYFQIGVGRR